MELEQYKRMSVAGIDIDDQTSTFIDHSSKISSGVRILPNTIIKGDCIIESGCVIGPNTFLKDVIIASETKVEFSHLQNSSIGQFCTIGPFARMRQNCRLHDKVSIGNFVELKDSEIGSGTKISHYSYVGDSTVGTDVNIGAGTITCNFDGENKHMTRIGNNAFIGSGTMLIAPVSIGSGAKTGAGSVVTHDVNKGVTVVGNPAKILHNSGNL